MTVRPFVVSSAAAVAGLVGFALALGAAPAVRAAASPQVAASHRALPLMFVENRGQAPGEARFVLQGRDTAALFGDRGVRFLVSQPGTGLQRHAANGRVLTGRPEGPALGLAGPTFDTAAVEMVGAREDMQPEGEQRLETVVSHFTGTPDEWIVGAPAFAHLVFRDAWPGIDAVWTGEAGRLKYTFRLLPGSDPADVRLRWIGAKDVRIAADGTLEVDTATRTLVDAAPIAWQDLEDGRVPVDVAYALDQATGTVTFALGEYDPKETLVLDPPTFAYAGFLGSSIDDRGLGVAVDSTGAAYMTGEGPNFANGYDIYVAKVNPAGTALSYLAFIGGTSYDAAYDIAVDAAGAAHVTGATDSAPPGFPVFVGPDLTYNGAGDAFVAKVNPLGTALEYCGYIGGSAMDFAEGIVLDAANNVYLTGPVASDEGTFPEVVGPDLTFNGRWDTFVAKMKAVPNSGVPESNFFYCGFIGGRGVDVGLSGGFVTDGHIAIDGAGAAYVSGMTKSTERTFPDGDGFGALPGFDKDHGGGFDGYALKVLPAGSGFAWATYIGGRKNDHCFGMGVDGAGNVWFAGDTSSPQTSFPVVGGPDLTYNGGMDAFVAKLNPSGTALLACGYIGGSDLEQGLGLVVRNGLAHVVGHTHSSEQTFPVVGGPDLTFNGISPDGDAFVARIKANPTLPVVTDNFDFCSYVGGSGEDSSYWVDVDVSGGVYVVGDTSSTQLTFPDGDGLGALPSFGSTQQGAYDGFLVKIVP